MRMGTHHRMGRRRGRPATSLAMAAILLGAGERAWSQNAGDTVPAAAPEAIAPPPPGPSMADGPRYPVSRFGLRYLHEGHPGHPPSKRLMRLKITLGRTPQGYVAPQVGIPPVTIGLAEVGERPLEYYYASAIQTILERIRDELTDRGLFGVYVTPDPQDITPTGEDLRPEDRTALRILITTAVVTELRTLASGERIDPQARVNNPAHTRIRERSPIQPAVEGEEPKQRKDLLRKDSLDDYIFYLSRHPGRRVDAALSPGLEVGTVALDYLVTENKPLVLYAQVSNTGTEQTDELRQRFGFIHNQLTNNDDVLSVDYITAGFDQVNAFVAGYETPLPGTERMRWRAYGHWSEFTASELGFFDDIFTGDSWAAGGDVIATIYQDRNLFVDFVAGVRLENIAVDNRIINVSGEQDFFLPHIGLRLDKRARWYRLLGAVFAEWNESSVTPLDSSQLSRLGRIDPDSDWGLVRWDLGAEVYLEPIVNRKAWEDPNTPQTSTLAHEVSFSFRGQYAFDNRLVPQFQQVIGGLYTVRGYPQSTLAGDSALIANIEYRYHLPRALALQPTPGELFGEPFRFAPQDVYGRPDWDLVLRAFFDVGRNIVNKRRSLEPEETLMGAGVGVELVYKRNFNFRLDWGFALQDVEARDIDAGSSRVYFVASIYF